MDAPNGVSLTCQAMAGKHILLTGTTGFLGKVVLERLLRIVPDLGGLHLLLRPNERCPDAQARYQREVAGSSIFQSPAGDAARKIREHTATRLHFVTGDLSVTRFGLSVEEFSRLADQVDLVINVAASVNFREELDHALNINTHSLVTLAEFAHLGGGIPVVHVSTCYVSGFHQGVIDETVLPPARTNIPVHPAGYFLVEPLLGTLYRQAADLRRQHDGDPEQQVRALIELGSREARRHGWNDTYTFTKWLGEQMLLQHMAGLPLTILRPSIIESTLRSPVPGWLEGVKVSDAIILAYARGKISVFPADPAGVLDIVPADLVANATILSAGELLRQPQGAPRIYQVCTGSSNPLRLGELVEHVRQELRSNWRHYDRLCGRRPWQPFIPVSQSTFDNLLRGVRRPLATLDRALQGLGRSRPLGLLGNVDVALRLSEIYSFYTAPRCIYSSTRLEALVAGLPQADRDLFPVDAKQVHWPSYIRQVHLPGLQRYAVKPRRARGVARGGSRLVAYGVAQR